MTVVARGLHAPRLLSFGRDGALYVPEAGSGGTGPCVAGPFGPVCLGSTGSVTRIRYGHQKRVLTGLPSLAVKGTGAEPFGPAAVKVGRHGRYLLNIGLAQDATTRHSLGAAARRMGTLVAGRFGGGSRVVADWAAFELAHNPDRSKEHDSDPTGFTLTRHGVVATDSGGNTLVAAGRRGIRALAVFPDVTTSAGPVEAVPTAVVHGRHGCLFVSQLTGAPFVKGAANIYRVRPGHAPTVWASGLTNVTDLAWAHGRLYAVQLATNGLLSPTGLPNPRGSLVRVHRGDNKVPDVVAGNLDAPYGVAIRGRSAYVTTGSTRPDHGKVLRIRLHR